MTQDVDPDAMLNAARVYSSVRTSAASAAIRLMGVLANSAGMAGTDTGAHDKRRWAVGNQQRTRARAAADGDAAV